MITDHTLSDIDPTLHYLSYAEADIAATRPVLIFLHGVTSHAHYWDHLAVDFTSEYAVYSLDWRGHGASAHSGGYSAIESYVSDLTRLIEELDPSRFVLVGHSMGGYVGLVYAAQGDSRLQKIVVCDVKANVTPEESEAFRRAAAKPQPRFTSLEELVSRFASTLHDSSADPALLAEIARQGAKRNEDGSYSFKYDRAVLDFPRPEPIKYAAMVNLPILVINGEKSEMVSAADAQQLAEVAPQGQHVEIAGVGHHAFLDRPAEFSRVVRQFLAGEA